MRGLCDKFLNGKPAGILLSPDNYDELLYKKSFLDSIARVISDAYNGRTYPTEDIRAKLAERRSEK